MGHMAYKQAVCGFCLLAPMIKDMGANSKAKEKDDMRRACQLHGQIVLMMLVIHSCEYNHILAHEEICMSKTPSWGLIKFLDNLSDIECARHLAERGVTPDELADANQYAFSWLQATQEHEKDVQTRIAINQLLNVPWVDNTMWPDSVSYHYSIAYGRWMPTLPATSTAPSQASISTSGLTPSTTEVVPAAAVATDILSTLTDENVNMEAPPDPPSDTMEDEMTATSSSP